jgi:squalene cyclase
MVINQEVYNIQQSAISNQHILESISFSSTGRFWCFCRLVYMPMSYLYGKKFVGPITHTILAIREELYSISYHEIDWNKARDTCAKVSFSKTCCSKHYLFWLEALIL